MSFLGFYLIFTVLQLTMAGLLTLLVVSSLLLNFGSARTPHRVKRQPTLPTFPVRFTPSGVTTTPPNPYIFTTLSSVSPLYEATLPAGYNAPPSVTNRSSVR